MNIRYVHQFSLLNQVFLFLLLQTLFMSTVCAQEIVVKDIPSLDKLPVKAIHRIFQDSVGYIWYGTFNGLCRSDGYDVRVFRSDLFHHGLLDDKIMRSIFGSEPFRELIYWIRQHTGSLPSTWEMCLTEMCFLSM